MATQRGAKKAKAVPKSITTAKKSARRVQQVSRTATTRRATTTATTSDYEGARQLLSRYCFALDNRRFDEIAPLFHREAAFSVSFESEHTHTGRDTIHAWYNQFYQTRPEQYRHPRHKLFEPMLSINGDTATASTYFDSDFLGPDGNVNVIAGRYDDVLMKEQGQWFFKQRTINVLYHYSPGKGEEGMQS
jgi:hypothetical protein